MTERWKQVIRAKEVLLDPFTQADLDAVTLDPEFLPAHARGPALPTVTPLLAALADHRGPRRQQDDGGQGPGGQQGGSGSEPGLPASPAQAALAPSGTGGDALAAAAERLERLGYLRPGMPAPADGPNPIPDELAGWSVSPAGQRAAPTGRRPVAILGDLGIITRMRSQPYWVAQASASAEPTRPDPLAARWHPVARIYTAYRPQAALVEWPAGPDGRIPPFTLLWEEFAFAAVMGWCGVQPADLLSSGQGRTVAERRADARRQLPEVPTAELAGRFTSVAQLRVAHPISQQVQLRRLIVASGEGGRWLLEGDRAQRACPVTIDQIGERLEAVLEPSGKAASPPGEAAPPPGEDKR